MNRIGTDFDRCDSARINDVLTQLTKMTGCPARMGSLRADGVVYWESGPGQVAAERRSDGSGPAHLMAVGQLMLALSDENAADEMITRELRDSGSADAMTRAEVEQALSLIRLSGVAVTRTPGSGRSLGVAVPVRRADGVVVAGLELGVDGFDQVESVLGDLQAASRWLSHGAADH